MRFCALPCVALLGAAALGVHLEDVDVVGEAVDERAGDHADLDEITPRRRAAALCAKNPFEVSP